MKFEMSTSHGTVSIDAPNDYNWFDIGAAIVQAAATIQPGGDHCVIWFAGERYEVRKA